MYREIEAAQQRQHDRRNEAIYLAWNVERIKLSTKVSQGKKGKTTRKLVKLETVLLPEPTTQPTRKSPAELKATLHALAARFGGRVRPYRG